MPRPDVSEIVTLGLIVLTVLILLLLAVASVRFTRDVLSGEGELETEEPRGPGRAAP